ncbi:MAG: hypothetical protein FWC97_01330 [Treponema sp.]|nr:hypothetical protein [Treponema sp.]
MANDWLPSKRIEQLAMAKAWINVFQTTAPSWQPTNTEKQELTELHRTARRLLAEVMSTERNTLITALCNEAFYRLTSHMCYLKDRYFLVPPLTDHDIVSLGLRHKDTKQTLIPRPTGQAGADITCHGVHLLMLHLRRIEGTHYDRITDYGYRIYFGIMPNGGATAEEASSPLRYMTKAAVTGEDLPHNKFSRRRKVLMEFPTEDSGKAAYFSIRFENAKGGRGPWGPVSSAIIP